ncbi:unnamed protein product [Ophioblennius macclurei]
MAVLRDAARRLLTAGGVPLCSESVVLDFVSTPRTPSFDMCVCVCVCVCVWRGQGGVFLFLFYLCFKGGGGAEMAFHSASKFVFYVSEKCVCCGLFLLLFCFFAGFYLMRWYVSQYMKTGCAAAMVMVRYILSWFLAPLTRRPSAAASDSSFRRIVRI